jgi:GH18 family chitinase
VFSNDPTTYHIFRNGVTPANRLTLATNIANFIRQHDLDGVDIDWEYPGASLHTSPRDWIHLGINSYTY